MCKFRELRDWFCQCWFRFANCEKVYAINFEKNLGDRRPTEIRGNFPNIAKISGLQTKSCQTINYCGNRCSRCHTHKQTITQLHGHVQQLQQPPAGGSCLPRVFWRIFASISSSCFSCNYRTASYSFSAAFRLRFSLLATDAHLRCSRFLKQRISSCSCPSVMLFRHCSNSKLSCCIT
jgi:hypothetical protein